MGERISLADAKASIIDAFNAAVAASYNLGADETADVADARDRVLTWIAQVEADQKRTKELLALAKAYETWEAELIMSVEAWEGGLREFPKMTEELWGRLLEIQEMRNEAVAKATK